MGRAWVVYGNLLQQPYFLHGADHGSLHVPSYIFLAT